MLYLLQKESEYPEIEIMTLREELEEQKHIHSYCFISLNGMLNDINKTDIDINRTVPVGSIEFVQAFLSKFYKIDHMSPIEVPKELRLSKFLRREYKIVDKENLLSLSEDLNCAFVKDVSKLKGFSFSGDLKYLMENYDIGSGPYVVSSLKNLLSEYRVFVLDDKILGINWYNGDPLIMPTPEHIKTIKEMVLRYSLSKTRPSAYTIDVAIVEEDKPEIMIIECHPFVSVGLYGFSGYQLSECYAKGFKWYKDCNIGII